MTSDQERLPTTCPSGFDEVRVSLVVSGRADEEASRHVLECATCARRYLDHIVIDAAARDIVRAAARVPAPRRHVWRLPHRVPIAAALLMAVAGAAIGASLHFLRPVFVAPAPGALGRVAEMEIRGGLDFEAAHLGPEAMILAWQAYVGDETGLGTAVVARTDVDGRIAVVGFGSDREPEWDIRSAWPDWATTLGSGGERVNHFTGVVSRRTGDALEETLVLSVSKGPVCGVFTLDPLTGARRGAPIFRAGVLGADAPYGDVVTVLPAPDGVGRSLLVYGSRPRDDGRAEPCALVFSAEGEVLQEVLLPTIGIGAMGSAQATYCEVDWTPGRERIRLDTSEHLICEIPVSAGRLDLDRARVLFQDSLSTAFNAAAGSEDAYDAWIAAAGDEAARQAEIAGDLREIEVDEEWHSWTGR